jgi:hypothetical protein
MGVTITRGLIGALGVVLMVVGIGVVAAPGPAWNVFGALFVFLPGALMLAGVILERTRYRSLHADREGDAYGRGGGEVGRPEARFRPTDEVFVDPTTRIRMRVYVDPDTGERRYLAEG